MRISEICIERPVLTAVMSLVILLFGAISLTRLPNRELPDILPKGKLAIKDDTEES